MQADYLKEYPTPKWDPVHINYPVRKFPGTGLSSESIGHRWACQPEVLKGRREPIEQLKDYLREYNITKELNSSQTTEDFGYKSPETKRFSKHTSSSENRYIYPALRRIADRPPLCSAHVQSEMKQTYTEPSTPARLVTDKDQYKHPSSLTSNPINVTPSWVKEIEPLDTTHDGFEKYLDPYLTTSRLHHRPFTADQLTKQSASKDVITYYTFANVTWTRTPNRKPDRCQLPLSKQKTIYDREKFKNDFREIRTHNKPFWTPSAFRTESRDNYKPESVSAYSFFDSLHADIKSMYKRRTGELPTNIRVPFEHAAVKGYYDKESSHIGSKRPLTAALDQNIEKNKRLEKRNSLRK